MAGESKVSCGSMKFKINLADWINIVAFLTLKSV